MRCSHCLFSESSLCNTTTLKGNKGRGDPGEVPVAEETRHRGRGTPQAHQAAKPGPKNKQLEPTNTGSWPRGATTALQSTKTKHMKREILRLGKGRCQWSPT